MNEQATAAVRIKAQEQANEKSESVHIIFVHTDNYGYDIESEDFQLDRKYYHGIGGRKMFFTFIETVKPKIVMEEINFIPAGAYKKTSYTSELKKTIAFELKETDGNGCNYYLFPNRDADDEKPIASYSSDNDRIFINSEIGGFVSPVFMKDLSELCMNLYKKDNS